MSASTLAAAAAVSFSLRSVQQQAVWLSGSVAQSETNTLTLSLNTDMVDLCSLNVYTVHMESIHSASLFPHFVVLQPYSKMD